MRLGLGPRLNDAGCGMCDRGYVIRDSGFEICNAGYGMCAMGYVIRDTDTGCSILDAG